MFNYPDAVAKIANDYLDRVREKLRSVPAHEQAEFIRELESHVYEAYRQTPGDDDVARILTVLRNLGDPGEVVCDRLPATMLRSGAKRSLPLYIIGGIAIALFGLPLGFGGFAVLMGLLVALAGVLIAYYAAAGGFLLAGGLFALTGLIRIVLPDLWDRLVSLGFIRIDGPVGNLLAHFPVFEQGLLILLIASPLLVSGLVMLRLGIYLQRGLRFLFTLVFDWMRRFAQSIRRKLRRGPRSPLPASELSFS
jgi:uncharacterized membrane protein